MAYQSHYTTKLEPGCHYHIYNRAVGNELLFQTAEHNRFFLSKVEKYVCPVAELLAYSLNRNHFHLTIEVHNDSTGKETGHAFRKLFQSYALAYNKEQGRHGTLFQTPFKRVLIDSDEYLKHLIWYQHWNPEHHQLVADYRDWRHSSYQSFLLGVSSMLSIEKVMEVYGGRQEFLAYHAEKKTFRRDWNTLED